MGQFQYEVMGLMDCMYLCWFMCQIMLQLFDLVGLCVEVGVFCVVEELLLCEWVLEGVCQMVLVLGCDVEQVVCDVMFM